MVLTKTPYDNEQLRAHIHDLPGEGETWRNDGEVVYVDIAERLAAAGVSLSTVHRMLSDLYWAAQRIDVS